MASFSAHRGIDSAGGIGVRDGCGEQVGPTEVAELDWVRAAECVEEAATALRHMVVAEVLADDGAILRHGLGIVVAVYR
jgi:hypothetical protein